MNEFCALCALRVGESALVTALRADTAMGRRLLDIGLISGTKVTCVAKSPAGDPAAYLIRGAVIALRRVDALSVEVELPALPQPVGEAVAI